MPSACPRVARLRYEPAGARILDTADLGSPAAPVLRVTLDNERRALEHPDHAGARTRPRFAEHSRETVDAVLG